MKLRDQWLLLLVIAVVTAQKRPQHKQEEEEDVPHPNWQNQYDFNPFRYELRNPFPRYLRFGPSFYHRPSYHFRLPPDLAFRSHPAPLGGFEPFNPFGPPRRYHVGHEYDDRVECSQGSPDHEEEPSTPHPTPPSFHQRYDGFQESSTPKTPDTPRGSMMRGRTRFNDEGKELEEVEEPTLRAPELSTPPEDEQGSRRGSDLGARRRYKELRRGRQETPDRAQPRPRRGGYL